MSDPEGIMNHYCGKPFSGDRLVTSSLGSIDLGSIHNSNLIGVNYYLNYSLK